MTIARKTVIISSTARDLPEHRKEVMDACLRQGMFPVMMEHLPANDDEAISASLKMVDEADIYVGVFAQRYGYIPKGKKRNPKQISITEMEYDRAARRKIPRLIFVMDKTHPITIDDIDIENAIKLKAFKDRLQTKNIVNFFKSPTDLRSHVINSLSKYFDPPSIALNKKELPTFDIGAYSIAIRKRYSVLALEGLTPPQKEEYLQIQLHSVFVEQNVRENPPPVELPKEVWEKLSRDKEIHQEDLPVDIALVDVLKAREAYYEKPFRLVLDMLTDEHYQQTIILGDPGSGKSTLARYVLLSLIDPSTADKKLKKTFNGYLPLLIELRTFAGLSAEGKCETPLEFFEHLGKTEGWGLEKAVLHNYLINDGRAVVIFDGLDEIFDPEQRERITNQIVGFTNDYPKVRVIVTSRVIGYRRKILADAGFTHFTLQDLEEKQVESFVTRWYELAMSNHPDEAKECRERILKSFKDSSSIRQLAGNPMLLTIMAIIGKHQELPRERWKLYDHAASVLIQHWDVNKHLKSERIEADFIGEDDKKEFLRRLAFQMQSDDGGLAGNYIHREQLQTEFENYLRERYTQPPERAKLITEAMIQQFRERNFILSLYGANLYGFVHRAFLEYFCALAFVNKFEKTQELTINHLQQDVYGKHWNDQSWHEVLRLISGMIDEKWTEKIVTYLAIETYQPLPKELDYRLPWNILLAIDCIKEVQTLNSFAKPAEYIISVICSLLERNMTGASPLYEFLNEKIIPSLGAIYPEWPNRSAITQWLRSRSANNNGFMMYGELFAKFINVIGHGLDEVHQELLNYSRHKAPNNRMLAIYALTAAWKNDSSTFQIISSLAQDDPATIVRESALDCLATHFTENHQSKSLIKAVAINDHDKQVRGWATRLFGRTYAKDPSTLEFILSNATSPNKELRGASLSTLGYYYSKIPEIRKLLWDIALDKKDTNGRAMIAFSFAKSYKDEPQTFDVLCDFLFDKSNSELRSAATWALGTRFANDPRTFALLKDVAIHDKVRSVRERAIRTIGEIHQQNQEILQLLQQSAIHDPSEDVRSAAITTIVDRFQSEPEILHFLLDRGKNDRSPEPNDKKRSREKYVRENVLNSIAKYWPTHIHTLSLLQDRVQNDPTLWLRERAKELIEEIESNEVKTVS